jgi:signal transduction histidine kinase
MTWLVFGLCALLVVDVLGWATWRVLALERAERAASAEADAAQRERLALWQMDSLVSALIARESARPYFEYRLRYAADLPYDRAWDLDAARVLAESPLARGAADPVIRLHFQVEPDGTITSPQADPDAPPGPDAAPLRAGRLVRELTAFERLDPAGPAAATAEKAPASSEPAVAADLGQSERIPEPGVDPDPDADLRRQLFDLARSGRQAERQAPTSARVQVGPFEPRWLLAPDRQTQLVFERTVLVGGEPYRQGLWIDWPSLRAELLGIAVRLLPGATIEPVPINAGPGARTLATIPLSLAAPAEPADIRRLTPTRLTLVVTWVAALTALAAIGLVLHAAMSLAERRGRFVAAVTHELRSPLTTFRLYTDLLARTDDAEKRRDQIEALRRESHRLGSVVENVLTYAGLRQSAAPAPVRALGDLLDEIVPSLAARAEQSGARLNRHDDPDARAARVRLAPGSLERILANLVDNACRYGLTDSDRIVTLTAERAGPLARLRVADRGPGVPAGERRRIFGDFFRGRTSRRSHSGMGLGLAIARGLARAEGGDLRLLRRDGPGACFEVSLRVLMAEDG